MENQIDVGDQNIQQIGQNPVSQSGLPSEKTKTNYLLIGGIILVCFVLFSFGGYYVGKLSSVKKSAPDLTVTQTATPTPTDETAQQKSGFIQGTVQSEAEAYVVGGDNISPVANFKLDIFEINSNKLVHTTNTDKDGKFTAQLTPGNYYFTYKFCPQSTNLQRVEFNIKPDQVNQKTFTLHFGPC